MAAYVPVKDLDQANAALSDLFGQVDALMRKASSAKDLLQAAYPIGHIYISADAANPTTVLGFGTWVAFGAGKALVGVDLADANFNAPEKTYGEKAHALTAAENGPHSHADSGHSHTINHDHSAVNTGTVSSGHTHNFNVNSGYVSNDHAHYVSGQTGGQSANHNHLVYNEGGALVGIQGGAAGSSFSITRATTTRGSTFYAGDALSDHSHGFGAWTGGINSNHIHNVAGTTGDINQNHSHTVDLPNYTGASGGAAAAIGASGSGTAHNNIPPSIAVYMWKRTA